MSSEFLKKDALLLDLNRQGAAKNPKTGTLFIPVKHCK